MRRLTAGVVAPASGQCHSLVSRTLTCRLKATWLSLTLSPINMWPHCSFRASLLCFSYAMEECGCSMSARWLGSSELTKRLRRMRVQSLKVIYYAVVVSDSSVTSYTVSRERFVLVAFNTWLLTRVLPRNIFCGLRLTSRHTC